MIYEEFNSLREFNNKYPSKFYICSNCNQLIDDKYYCRNCGWRADGLLKTWDKGYKYKLLDSGRVEEIFKPMELLKEEGKQNG